MQQMTIFFFFFYFFFRENKSAEQTIHMKCQDLFSLKKKKIRMLSAANFAWCFKG